MANALRKYLRKKLNRAETEYLAQRIFQRLQHTHTHARTRTHTHKQIITVTYYIFHLMNCFCMPLYHVPTTAIKQQSPVSRKSGIIARIF